MIIVGGLVASFWINDHRDDVEAAQRQMGDCQSLNDRTRFGLMSREDALARIDERVAELQQRVDEPLDVTDFPGYDELDQSTRAFVNGLNARSRETSLLELANEREKAAVAQADLTLYKESIPLLDCNGNEEIDDGDFTGR